VPRSRRRTSRGGALDGFRRQLDQPPVSLLRLLLLALEALPGILGAAPLFAVEGARSASTPPTNGHTPSATKRTSEVVVVAVHQAGSHRQPLLFLHTIASPLAARPVIP